jgi:hypothetical protein
MVAIKPLLLGVAASYIVTKLRDLATKYGDIAATQSLAIVENGAQLSNLTSSVASMTDELMAKTAELAAIRRACEQERPMPVAGPASYEIPLPDYVVPGEEDQI